MRETLCKECSAGIYFVPLAGGGAAMHPVT
jgi:hypothetical protein